MRQTHWPAGGLTTASRGTTNDDNNSGRALEPIPCAIYAREVTRQTDMH